jgi:hypothetical protein
VTDGDRPVWQIPFTGNEATSFGGLLIFPLVESNSDMVSILSGHGCFCDVCGSILSLVVLRSPAPQSITPNGPPLHAFGLLHPLAQGSYWRRLNKRPSATLKQQGMQTRRWRSKDTRSLLFRSKESKRLSVLSRNVLIGTWLPEIELGHYRTAVVGAECGC